MSILKKIRLILSFQISLLILKSFSFIYRFYPKTYKNKIWIIGQVRSGTTWISSLLNGSKKYRRLFEPFHIKTKIGKNLGFEKYKYLHNNNHYKLQSAIGLIFKGRIFSARIDIERKFPWYYDSEYLIIKDVFANLMSFQICNSDASIKPILVIRNPFAVAVSVKHHIQWDWLLDPIALLNQYELVQDHLSTHIALIEEISAKGSFWEKQILIWSIIYYVPFTQFRKNQIYLSFYENWLIDPILEIKAINEYIGGIEFIPIDIIKSELFSKNSSTSEQKYFDVLKPGDQISSLEIEKCKKILDHFGLTNLYLSNGMPNKVFLEKSKIFLQ